MQAYNNGKLFETLSGRVADLENRKNELLSTGKTKVNIGILPKIGQEIIVDSLTYQVTRVNEFGKVIMMLTRRVGGKTMNREAICKYMGWDRNDCSHPGLKCPPYNLATECVNCLYACGARLDANDMILAMNKMVEKGDWYGFEQEQKEHYSRIIKKIAGETFTYWLMQPDRFFELVSDWFGK